MSQYTTRGDDQGEKPKPQPRKPADPADYSYEKRNDERPRENKGGKPGK